MEKVNLEFIAKRRAEYGITLKEMAVSLGFKNASTYHKYEKGEYDFKANHLPILACKLKCQLSDLFKCIYMVSTVADESNEVAKGE